MHPLPRRALLATPALLAHPALAQPRGRVVILSPGLTLAAAAFRQALAALGHGAELAVEEHTQALDSPAVAAAARAASVIFAVSPPAILAARRHAPQVPVVAMDLELDPVRAGLVESVGRPGGQVTGLFLDQPGITAKWLQMLAECLPGLNRVGMLWQPGIGEAQAAALTAAGPAQGVAVEPHELRMAEVEGVMAGLRRQGVRGLVLLSAPTVFQNRARLAPMAREHGLATVTMFKDFAEAGGLLTYGPDRAAMGRDAAGYVDQILRGRRAADLPLQRPTRFELVVNLATARTLGVTVPPSLLAGADEVLD